MTTIPIPMMNLSHVKQTNPNFRKPKRTLSTIQILPPLMMNPTLILPKKIYKNTPKNIPKIIPKNILKNIPNSIPKNTRKNIAKNIPKSTPKEPPKRPEFPQIQLKLPHPSRRGRKPALTEIGCPPREPLGTSP